MVSDKGGVWLSFWTDGGVMYFKDGQVRASYSVRDGLGKGHVPGLALESDGALWASTDEGGLSRIKDGHVATLTSRNGLPCDTIHGTVQDDRRSLWVYAACGSFASRGPSWTRGSPSRRTVSRRRSGMQRMGQSSVRSRRVAMSLSSRGRPTASCGSSRVRAFRYSIRIDLASNPLRPPVYVERLTADGTVRWQHLPGGTAVANLRLPPRVRDVQIDYTALSLVAPEKVRFRYRLEGQDHDWREVVNDRHVQYSNLGPGTYRFRVIASNNSGVWNEQGDTLEFSVEPAYYQTNWFRALCAGVGLWCSGRATSSGSAPPPRVRDGADARGRRTDRIARDLHDTLLQSFHGSMLRFAVVSQLIPEASSR